MIPKKDPREEFAPLYELVRGLEEKLNVQQQRPFPCDPLSYEGLLMRIENVNLHAAYLMFDNWATKNELKAEKRKLKELEKEVDWNSTYENG